MYFLKNDDLIPFHFNHLWGCVAYLQQNIQMCLMSMVKLEKEC